MHITQAVEFRYQASELFDDSSDAIHHHLRSKASDIYSFGIIVWELVMRKQAFADGNIVTIRNAVLAGKRPQPLPTEPHLAGWVALMKGTWADTPSDRIASNDLAYEVERLVIAGGLTRQAPQSPAAPPAPPHRLPSHLDPSSNVESLP